MNQPLRVAVLYGGPSAERAVSLVSGAAVAAGLNSRGHVVTLLDPTPGGDAVQPLGSGGRQQDAERVLRGYDWTRIDIVCNVLHGTFGEDGCLQELLDELDVPYTGSGAPASRTAFCKSLAKAAFQQAGVPTPRGLTFDGQTPVEVLHRTAEKLGWPVVIKPEAQGSSLGVRIVRTAAELLPAVQTALTLSPLGLLEEYIAGTEWTVPVWDDEVLPMIEIVPGSEFYDYAAKYADDRTTYRFSFEIVAEVQQRIAAVGLAAAQAVGCQGLSRVDLRLRPDGQPIVLEVNTSPGMTDHSLVPKSAARCGLSLGELCERDCLRTLKRCRSRRAA